MPPDSPSKRPGRYFIAAGISRYRDEKPDAWASGQDGGDAQEYLGLCDLPWVERDVETLTDFFTNRLGYQHVLPEATRSPVRAQLEDAITGWLASPDRCPDDTVVLYFAGHGTVILDEHYLCARGFDGRTPARNGIRTEELVRWFFGYAGAHVGNVWLMLDVCHAGWGADEAASVVARLRRAARAPDATGFWVLAAARAYDLVPPEGGFARTFVEVVQELLAGPPHGGPEQDYLRPDAIPGAINRRLEQLHVQCRSDQACVGNRDLFRFVPNPGYRPGPWFLPTVRRPDPYVPRPEIAGPLQSLLLPDRTVAPGAMIVAGLHGMPGVGKSAVAADLAWGIADHFRHGVQWIDVGQQFDPLRRMSEWLGQLNPKLTVAESESGCADQLGRELSRKSLLLVLDDVWEPQHARPFLVGGPECRFLITSRNAAVLAALNAARVELDVMSPEQSLELLRAKLNGIELRGEVEERARELAEVVGHLPLALELAAARIAQGRPWQALTADLKAEIARLEVLSAPGASRLADEDSRRRLSVSASFNLSLRILAPEERRRFAWLGVLPDDAIFTATMAGTLWGTDDGAAAEYLEDLHSLALVQRSPGSPRGGPGYRLHDLLHAAARGLLTNPQVPARDGDLPGLELTLAQANQQLLEQYRARAAGGAWHSLPDDGYFHAHLLWHLEGAGQAGAVHDLLAETSVRGGNGWYETCELIGQPMSFLTTLRRAWGLTEEAGETSPGRAIGLQCRYALIAASLQTFSQNIPPELMAAYRRAGLWTDRQALTHAQQVPDADQRIQALAALAPALEPRHLPELAAGIRAVGDERAWALIFRALASRFQENEWLWRQALAETMRVPLERSRARALFALVESAPVASLPELLTAARALHSPRHRSRLLCELAGRLSRPLQAEVIREAVQAVGEQKRSRGARLVRLAPSLEGPLWDEVLDAVHALDSEPEQAEALEGLAPFVPEPLLPRALEIAHRLQFMGLHQGYLVEHRVRAVAALAPRLPPDLVMEALDRARALRSTRSRSELLARLTPGLPEPMRSDVIEEALATACVIPEERFRAEALGAIAPHLATFEPLLEEAFAQARLLKDGHDRVIALAGLAPHLTKSHLEEALGLVQVSANAAHAAQILAAMAPRLTPPQKERALDRALTIEHGAFRAQALAGLAPHLFDSPALMTEVLRASRVMRFVRDRAVVLAAAAPHVAPSLRDAVAAEALEAIGPIGYDGFRAEHLAALAPHLSARVVARALVAARGISSARWRAHALAALAGEAGALSEEARESVRQQALDAIRDIEPASLRCRSLVALAAQLAGSQRLDRLYEALGLAQQLWPRSVRAQNLVRLIVQLPSRPPVRLLRDLLGAAYKFGQCRERTQIIYCLAPRLPRSLVQEALTAEGIYWTRTEGLLLRGRAASLASGAERAEVLDQAIAASQEDRGASGQAEALIDLATSLPTSLRRRVIEAARTAVDALDDRRRKAELLAELIPHLPHASRDAAIQEVLGLSHLLPETWGQVDSSDEEPRARLFATLAPYLPPALLRQALAKDGAFIWEHTRIQALVGAAARSAVLLPAELWQEALRDAGSISGTDAHRMGLTRKLATVLPGEFLDDALREIRMIDPRGSRAKMVAHLAPHLAKRPGLLGEALTAVAKWEDEPARAEALVALAPHLTEALLARALDIALAIGRVPPRVTALVAVAPRCLERLEEVLAAVWSIEPVTERAKVLSGLEAHLSRLQLAETLAVARRIGDPKTAAELRVALVPDLPDPEREAGAIQALAEMQAAGGESLWVRALTALAPQLSETSLSEALRRTYSWEGTTRDVVEAVAPHIGGSEPLQRLALDTARGIQDEWYRVPALLALAPHLSAVLAQAALTAAGEDAIRDEGRRLRVLIALAPRLSEPERGQVLQELPASATKLTEADTRAEVLVGLVPHFSGRAREEVIEQALAAVRSMRGQEGRAALLALLAEPLRPLPRLMHEALAGVRAMELDPGDPRETRPNQILTRGRRQKEALAALIPGLTASHREDVLEIALAIRDDFYRLEAIIEVAPCLSEPLARKALTALKEIQERMYEPVARIALACRLPESRRGKRLETELETALANDSASERSYVVGRLALYLTESLRRRVFDRLQAEEPGRPRAEAMARFLPHMPRPLDEATLRQILPMMKELEQAEDRAGILATLAAGIRGLTPSSARSLWYDVLHQIANRTRGDLLTDLRVVAPVIHHLGGAEAVVETLRGLERVAAWWP